MLTIRIFTFARFIRTREVMLKLFLLTLVVVVVAMLLLGVNVFFFKKKFPNTHVGGNKALNKKGVYCVQTQDYMERHSQKNRPSDEAEE